MRSTHLRKGHTWRRTHRKEPQWGSNWREGEDTHARRTEVGVGGRTHMLEGHTYGEGGRGGYPLWGGHIGRRAHMYKGEERSM